VREASSNTRGTILRRVRAARRDRIEGLVIRGRHDADVDHCPFTPPIAISRPTITIATHHLAIPLPHGAIAKLPIARTDLQDTSVGRRRTL
jgi:hypothetical protein